MVRKLTFNSLTSRAHCSDDDKTAAADLAVAAAVAAVAVVRPVALVRARRTRLAA
jgi:hypothetical protein